MWNLNLPYDSFDRTLLLTVLDYFGVPQNIISVGRQFHDDMRACVQLDDRMCSGWFAVKQGLYQGCVLAPILFSIFFTAAINVAYTCFKASKDIVDALVHLRKKTEARGRGEGASNLRRASPGDVAMRHALRWRCRGRLAIARVSEEGDGGIVVVCARRLTLNRITKKLRTDFEMGTDGHRFSCFQFGIS